MKTYKKEFHDKKTNNWWTVYLKIGTPTIPYC